jgi:adenylylsulfate kinase
LGQITKEAIHVVQLISRDKLFSFQSLAITFIVNVKDFLLFLQLIYEYKFSLVSLAFVYCLNPSTTSIMSLLSAKRNGLTNLPQNGIVIWIFGLSGSGKTTISTLLKEKLEEEGFYTVSLDGDILREGINKHLGFSEADRTENIRRAAEIAKLMLKNNLITICSFITPLEENRLLAAEIIGEGYFEVFLDCPLSICKERDVKGLYKNAGLNLIKNFTGISAKFEPAVKADLVIKTYTENPDQSMDRVFSQIISKISSHS